MHINGVWEVPTMVDLAKKGQLFDWGAIQIPVFYAQPATWADSHSFAIPDRKGNPVAPEKRKLVLDTIHWFNVTFARMGGRRPYAGLSAGAGQRRRSRTLKPNSDYSSLAKTAVFDPVSILRRRRLARSMTRRATTSIPAMNGEMAPADAAKKMRDDLQSQPNRD